MSEHTLEPIIAYVGKGASHGETGEHAGAAKAAEHTAEHSAEEISTERWLAGLSVVLAGFGILLGWFYVQQ